MKFEKGTVVRERGKLQKMTVVGPLGLATASTSPGIGLSSPGKVACEWVNAKGRTIQRGFAESNLEIVKDDASA